MSRVPYLSRDFAYCLVAGLVMVVSVGLRFIVMGKALQSGSQSFDVCFQDFLGKVQGTCLGFFQCLGRHEVLVSGVKFRAGYRDGVVVVTVSVS